MTLVFGQPGTAAASFQLDVTSQRSFPDVLATLRQAIDQAGMKLLHEIDLQGALRSVDQATGGARLLFFFHPQLLARLLGIDGSAVIEAPLKLAVLEMPDGTVSIRAANPAIAFGRYGNPDLDSFGQELLETCGWIVHAAT